MAEVPNFRVQAPEEAEEISVGDRVRSYDFAFKDDCYVEGVVKHTDRWLEGCPRYEIQVERRMSLGKAIEADGDHVVYPPRNGTATLTGGYTNGVRKIEP